MQDLPIKILIFNCLLFYINIAEYIYIILNFYRLICFTHLTFQQIPLLNPYRLPYSLIRIFSAPYFRWWNSWLPKITFGGGSLINISVIIGFEFLSCSLRLVQILRTYCLLEIDKIINSI